MEHKNPVNLVVLSRTLRLPLRWLKAEAEAGRIPSLKAEDVLLFDVDAVQKVLSQRAAQQPGMTGFVERRVSA